MKKIALAFLSASLLVLFSCKEKEDTKPVEPDPEQLTVQTSTVNADKGDGTVEIPVSSNYSFSVTISDDAKGWLSHEATRAEVKSSTVVIAHRANPLAKTRSGVVTIKGQEQQYNVTVIQDAGDATISADLESLAVNPRGQEFTVTVESNDDVDFSSNVSWARMKENKDNAYVITVDLNDSGSPREAEIKFLCVSDPAKYSTVTVTQKAANVDPHAISILAVGNSFSVDCMEYLYPILTELGYTKIRLGNLYIGGCSLETHATNFEGDLAEYTYYSTSTETEGVWKDSTAVAPKGILEPDDWDYISLQQVSGKSGIESSYDPYLEKLISSIREYCPFTPFIWNMTWAYQGNSTHADFANYGKNQETMYDDIVSAVQSKIDSNKEFEIIIPTGTAVQNLRTSFMEDNLTRDGYHLSYNIGRPLAALMWAKAISGKSIDDVTFLPSETTSDGKPVYRYEPDYLPAMKEAVNAAAQTPYKVTPSAEHAPLKSVVPNDALRAVASAAGYDLDEYEEVPLTIFHNAYYNSSADSKLRVAFNGYANDANLDVFAATRILDKTQLPLGTIIVLKEGYQFRPDGWTALTAVTSSRPAVIKAAVTVVENSWASLNFRAFNLNKIGADGGNATLTNEEMTELDSCISVFLPKTALGFGGLEDYENGNWNW